MIRIANDDIRWKYWSPILSSNQMISGSYPIFDVCIGYQTSHMADLFVRHKFDDLSLSFIDIIKSV